MIALKKTGILNKYPFFAPLLVLASNVFFSFFTRPFLDTSRLFDMTTAFDKKIPFIPEFIYIYVLAYIQWALCIIAVMLIDREKSNCYCLGIVIADIIAGVMFLAVPTVMTIRPEFSGTGLTGWLVKFIFSADNPPYNIFPSVHCIFSWGCARAVFSVKRIPLSLKIINAVFSVLVFLSVLFVKQHAIVDIPAGILAFEAGLLLVRLIKSNVR